MKLLEVFVSALVLNTLVPEGEAKRLPSEWRELLTTMQRRVAVAMDELPEDPRTAVKESLQYGEVVRRRLQGERGTPLVVRRALVGMIRSLDTAVGDAGAILEGKMQGGGEHHDEDLSDGSGDEGGDGDTAVSPETDGHVEGSSDDNDGHTDMSDDGDDEDDESDFDLSPAPNENESVSDWSHETDGDEDSGDDNDSDTDMSDDSDDEDDESDFDSSPATNEDDDSDSDWSPSDSMFDDSSDWSYDDSDVSETDLAIIDSPQWRAMMVLTATNAEVNDPDFVAKWMSKRWAQ